MTEIPLRSALREELPENKWVKGTSRSFLNVKERYFSPQECFLTVLSWFTLLD